MAQNQPNPKEKMGHEKDNPAQGKLYESNS